MKYIIKTNVFVREGVSWCNKNANGNYNWKFDLSDPNDLNYGSKYEYFFELKEDAVLFKIMFNN